MENTPLVSIILPTYNRVNLISRAIDSVLAQTYSNWELIIWDDGSNDDTEKVVGSNHDKRIQYFYDENHGVYYARNQAIRKSEGKYLAFLDSDDEWISEKLHIQVNTLEINPQVDLVFSDFINVNETSHKKYRAFEQYMEILNSLDVEKIDRDTFIIRDGIPEKLTEENIIALDSVVLRAELLERIGSFQAGMRNSADFELWWRMGLAGVCFAYIDKVCLHRYKGPGSLSSQSIPQVDDYKKVLDICLEETRSKGRTELVPNLNHLYRNAWQNLIPLYAQTGDQAGMFNAFRQSLQYGIRLGTFRMLLQAIMSYKSWK
jgi:glycosyltransferase involved in cell wall biosynthesis